MTSKNWTQTGPVPPEANGGNRTILVVDDEIDLRVMVARFLRHRGYEVATAPSADEARVYLDQGRPCDLMVLDLMMPGTPGIAFLRELRAKETRTLPVVLLTAKSTMTDVAEGYNKGAEFYITKPFEPDTLVKAVDFLVGDLPVEELAKIEIALLNTDNVFYGLRTICYR